MPVLKPIRIIVKNGHVTLEGVVANDGDRNIVNIRANGVYGVFSVTNNLQVEKVGQAHLRPRTPPPPANASSSYPVVAAESDL